MTTITKAKPRKATRTHKRREVSESTLPVRDDGKLDMTAVLEFSLTAPGHISQCYSRFHHYSMLNCMLVMMQTGKLEPIATFNRWKELDRKVTKGSKALFVNHPRFAPDIDQATGQPKRDDNGKVTMKVVGFAPRATVFQLWQTDGEDLVMPDVPDWNRDNAMKALDVTEVPFSHPNGNTQGYSHDREFAINPVAEYPFKTMIHEWAHILLGHTAEDYEYHDHRGIAEFQAESVALLVCSDLGVDQFDASASRGYIQNWLSGTDAEFLTEDGELAVTDTAVRKIFAVVDEILTAGRGKGTEE